MALNATSPEHQMQIIAGTEGRKKGHKFEKTLTEHINELDNKLFDFLSKFDRNQFNSPFI